MRENQPADARGGELIGDRAAHAPAARNKDGRSLEAFLPRFAETMYRKLPLVAAPISIGQRTSLGHGGIIAIRMVRLLTFRSWLDMVRFLCRPRGAAMTVSLTDSLS